MRWSKLVISILVACLAGGFAWHWFQLARQRAMEAQRATEAAAAEERRLAEIRQQQRQKREDFARACTEGTRFGVVCSAGGQDGTILAIAYGHADEDFLKGLVSDADPEGQPARFGRALAATGFTLLLATDGKRYWAAEPCVESGICKWHEEAPEPNPWTPTTQPQPESLRLDKEVSLGVTGNGRAAATYKASSYAGKIVALAALSPKSDKLEPDEHRTVNATTCQLQLDQIVVRQNALANQCSEGAQACQEATRQDNRLVEMELLSYTVPKLLDLQNFDQQCPSLTGNETAQGLLSDESQLYGGHVYFRLNRFIMRYDLTDQIRSEFPGLAGSTSLGEMSKDYIAYLERQGLANQFLVEDLAENQVIFRQR